MATNSELEGLLAQTRWVQALARRLTSGSDADDLAQEAWVRALERPPRDERARGAWFRRVLVNLKREGARREVRRHEREQGAARELRHESSDVVERAELSRRLVQRVLELDEPYRATVLARYFDGLSPEEIARHRGEKASTVRTRIERGLARLKERLERENGSEWLRGLALLANAQATPTAGIGAAGSTIGSGILVANAVWKAAAVAAVLAAAWWWRPVDAERENEVPPLADRARLEREEERPLTSERASVALDESSSNGSNTPASPGVSDGALSDAELDAEYAAQSAPGVLEGIVLRARRPVDGGTVYIRHSEWETLPDDPRPLLGALSEGAVEARPIGSDGRFRIAPLDEGWHVLGVDVGGGATLQIKVRVFGTEPNYRVVVELGSAGIEGHVWDAEGGPVAGAAIHVSRNLRGRAFSHYATSNREGWYSVPDLEPCEIHASVDRRGARGFEAQHEDMQRVWRLQQGEMRRIDFGAPQRSTRIRGRLLTLSGTPLTLRGSVSATSSVRGPHNEVHFEAGEFELRVPPGRWELRAKLQTNRSGLETPLLELGSFEFGELDQSRDFVIPGATVHGRVIAPDAAALPNGLRAMQMHPDGRAALTVEVAPNGEFLLFAVEPGSWKLELWPELAPAAETWFEVREGERELRLDLPARRR
jgi:RNA polymerase sigma-70 factor (ECF subfamily)